MEIGIRLNVGTCILVGTIVGLGYKLYIKSQKMKLIIKEIERLKDMKGETVM